MRRILARSALFALILNEVRGVIVLALTWPLWWPAIEAVFHAAMRGRL